MNKFVTIIVPAGSVETSRAVMSNLPGCAGMFTTACYTGDTITHYISSGKMSADIAAAVLAGAAELYALIQEAAPETTTTLAEVQAFIDASDRSTDEVAVVLGRIGATLGGGEA